MWEDIFVLRQTLVCSGVKRNNVCNWLILILIWASLVAQTVKNPPAMRKTWVRSLGWEDALGEGMAIGSWRISSVILAWRIPRTKEPGGLQSRESQRVGYNCSTLHTHTVSNSHSSWRLAHSHFEPDLGGESKHLFKKRFFFLVFMIYYLVMPFWEIYSTYI